METYLNAVMSGRVELCHTVPQAPLRLEKVKAQLEGLLIFFHLNYSRCE